MSGESVTPQVLLARRLLATGRTYNSWPRGHSSVGRAPGLHPGGRRFEPGWLHALSLVTRSVSLATGFVRAHPKGVMRCGVANDRNAARRRTRLHPDAAEQVKALVVLMTSEATAVCGDVPPDESRRPIYEAAQDPMPRSEEQQLAFGGAGGYPGVLPRLVACEGEWATISTRVERLRRRRYSGRRSGEGRDARRAESRGRGPAPGSSERATE